VRVVIGDYEVQLKGGSRWWCGRSNPGAGGRAFRFPFRLVFALFGIALLGIVAAGVWRRSISPR